MSLVLGHIQAHSRLRLPYILSGNDYPINFNAKLNHICLQNNSKKIIVMPVKIYINYIYYDTKNNLSIF